MFLQTIRKRSEEELTKRVYLAQKADAVKGDFAKLVKADIELIEWNLEEDYISMKSKTAFKEDIQDAKSETLVCQEMCWRIVLIYLIVL